MLGLLPTNREAARAWSTSLAFEPRSRTLRPLFSVKVNHREVIVTFDLPYVERNGITLNATESTVELDATLKKAATVKSARSVQKTVRVEHYKARVWLPRTVNPGAAKASFKNGLLTVRLPTASPGTKVKVG